jgi:hypothetical protein
MAAAWNHGAIIHAKKHLKMHNNNYKQKSMLDLNPCLFHGLFGFSGH